MKERFPEYAMVQLEAGSALIDLVDVSAVEGVWAKPPVAGGRNLYHFCLALGRHDEIIEEGVHGGARGDSLSLYVRDPSGNVIELKAPPPDAAGA